MKKIFILIALVFLSLSASAQLASDLYSENHEYEDGWLKKGYRGFIEIGIPCTIKEGTGAGFSINTIHGYQCSEWFFIGGGLGYSYIKDAECYYDYDRWSHDYYAWSESRDCFKIYGDFKLTIPTGSRFYPFLEVRPGIAVPEVGWLGVFSLEIPVGCRIALNDKLGLNVGASFHMFGQAEVYTVGPNISLDF